MKKIALILLAAIIPISSFSQPWMPLNSGVTNNLLAVYFTNDLTGHAVGEGGLITKTTDGGITWNTITSGASPELFDVRFVSLDTGYTVGRDGVILKTTDAGLTWNSVSTMTAPDFTSVYNFGNNTFVTGYGGTILKSSDGGLLWDTLNTGVSDYLYGTFFTDLNTGYAVGYPGIILKTTDGGANWTQLVSGTSIHHLTSICFTDSNNGYIAGGDLMSGTNEGIILKTTDGGTTWTSQLFPDNYLTKIIFLDSLTGYVAGGDVAANTSTILKTIDGGTSWSLQSSSSSRQYGASFPGTSVGYTCGLDGTILKITLISTGTNQFSEQNSFTVIYPNPGNGIITVQSGVSNSRIEIRDAAGKLIYSDEMIANSLEIDFMTKPKGIYFVHLLDTRSNTIHIEKIVIE